MSENRRARYDFTASSRSVACRSTNPDPEPGRRSAWFQFPSPKWRSAEMDNSFPLVGKRMTDRTDDIPQAEKRPVTSSILRLQAVVTEIASFRLIPQSMASP